MIWNISKKNIISKMPVVAVGFCGRGRGMIAREFRDFDAMVFHHCGAVHTMFMSLNLDILFIDCENRICGISEKTAPWKFLIRKPGAITVIEMPEGTIEKTDSRVGDFVDLNAELEDKKILFKGNLDVVVPAVTAISFKSGN